MDNIFVVNAGSSSLKYQLINMENESVLVSGNCERIGIGESVITYKWKGQKKIIKEDLPTHKKALETVVSLLTSGDTKMIDTLDDIIAVGHRVAISMRQSVEITEEIMEEIEKTRQVAPLHVPPMITGIRACQETFAGKLQVAVFDNSFHLSMPPKAYLYAIPYELYEKHGIRRYGYHGTSHRYVTLRLAQLLGKKPEDLKIISCHLGNGSSIAAVDGGKSIDTTMGYTPTAGLAMGTRSGDIDPSVVFHIAKIKNLNIDEVNDLLNKKSGLLGVSGVSSDDRDLEEAVSHGNEYADLAQEIVRYQIKKYIGSYTAVMNGLDAIIFTGGIGEHSTILREGVCEDMTYFGLQLDKEKNQALNGKEAKISTDDSRTQIWIIPTNEELMIARDAYEIYCKKNNK